MIITSEGKSDFLRNLLISLIFPKMVKKYGQNIEIKVCIL